MGYSARHFLVCPRCGSPRVWTEEEVHFGYAKQGPRKRNNESEEARERWRKALPDV